MSLRVAVDFVVLSQGRLAIVYLTVVNHTHLWADYDNLSEGYLVSIKGYKAFVVEQKCIDRKFQRLFVKFGRNEDK